MRSLDDVIPVVCTLDEEPNLERCLRGLTWARAVVVLDSRSTDATERIARSFPNVHWYVRPFDDHAGQWTQALELARGLGPVALALDADMEVSAAWVNELRTRILPGFDAGAYVTFRYAYAGHAVLGSLRRPEPRLFDLLRVRVVQEGHTQRFQVTGGLARFRTPLVHDDQKGLDRWVRNQLSYARLEAADLLRGRGGALRHRLRRAGLMPMVAFVLGYLRAGGPFHGAAAMAYACERGGFECLLGLTLARARLGLDGQAALPAPAAPTGPA